MVIDGKRYNSRTDKCRVFIPGGKVGHVTRHVRQLSHVRRSTVKVTRSRDVSEDKNAITLWDYMLNFWSTIRQIDMVTDPCTVIVVLINTRSQLTNWTDPVTRRAHWSALLIHFLPIGCIVYWLFNDTSEHICFYFLVCLFSMLVVLTTGIRIQTVGLAFGGTGLCSGRVRGVDGSCAKHLTLESYMIIYASNSHTY